MARQELERQSPKRTTRRLATALWVTLAGSSVATGLQTPETRQSGSDTASHDAHPHKEAPDATPGVPATPVAGSLPAGPFTVGGFTSVQVNVDALGANIPGDAANETSIAVDPTQPNRMAIGWRQFDTIASNFREAGWAWTDDGGRTWTFPGVLENNVFRSDPVLSFDSSGTFYYNSLQVPDSSTFLCDVFRSVDAGKTWEAPVSAFGGDKAWMTVDRSGGPGDGNVYCSWSVFFGCCGSDIFTRSLDGAQSFSLRSAISASPLFGTLAVGPDGTLYSAGRDPGDSSQFLVARSFDAQLPFGSPTFTSTVVDLGGSWTSSQGPNPAGLLGQVTVAVDPSSGDVYACSSVDPPGPDPLDVYVARSTDDGATWLPPVRVNDDPTGSNSWQWFGTLSVAPSGRLDVVWNDTRASGQDNVSELYYSFSVDHGATWSPNAPASPSWDSHLGWPNQNKIGDYYDMVSDDVGAHLAWSATFNGEQDVYYLRIGDWDCNSNGIGDEDDLVVGTSPDANGNGIPDECEPEVGTPSCFGVGCPCGNDDPSAGCANSTGSGGLLAARGSASVTADDLVLEATGLSLDDQGLFYMGDTQVLAPLFDGFQCALGNTFRFLDSTQSTGAAGSMSYAAVVAGSGALISAGATWHFHAWHRDFPTSPCGTGANFTSLLSITFEP